MSRCECGKYRYWSRKAAKLAIRRIQRRRDLTSRLAAYRCTHDDTCWHIGHVPSPIKRGVIARSDFVPKPRPATYSRPPKETNE